MSVGDRIAEVIELQVDEFAILTKVMAKLKAATSTFGNTKAQSTFRIWYQQMIRAVL